VAAVLVPYGEKFGARAQLAVVEFHQYLEQPQAYAETSIGQRLEQWRTAIHLFEQEPLTGWGVLGVVRGKQELVDQGKSHPSIMSYGHAHNEVIDMLVKRGGIGGIALLLFYAVPLGLFWPTRQRIQRVAIEERSQALAVRVAASMLPIAYFGFGWTQVFFAHNSGNIFYLFAIVAFWAALQQLERSPKAD